MCAQMLPHPGWAASSWMLRVTQSGGGHHLAITAGEPGLMTTYELLALLFSIIIWAPFLRKCRLGMMAHLDSESALFVAAKLASPHPKANLVAAELALRTEQLGIESILGQHWANSINIWGRRTVPFSGREADTKAVAAPSPRFCARGAALSPLRSLQWPSAGTLAMAAGGRWVTLRKLVG